TRRILRIFPLYYGVLAVCLLLGVGPIRHVWPWHVSYLSNLYYAWHGHRDPLSDPFLHLWSLSVEEQFYLFWPLFLFIAKPRALKGALYAVIGIAMAYRLGVAHLAPHVQSIRYLTPCCLDAFAIGALVAHTKHFDGAPQVRSLARRLALIGSMGLLFSYLVL